eukprot:5613261-Prymnesium_polylepis.4
MGAIPSQSGWGAGVVEVTLTASYAHGEAARDDALSAGLRAGRPLQGAFGCVGNPGCSCFVLHSRVCLVAEHRLLLCARGPEA